MSNILRTSVSVSALAVGIMLSSQAARAADPMEQAYGPNWYVSVFGGGSFASALTHYDDDVYDVRLNDGFTVGVAVGSHLGNGLRFERELTYLRHANDETRYDTTDNYSSMSGNTEAIFLLANLWKDIDIGFGSVYAGGGLGTAFVQHNGEWADDETGDITGNDSGIGLAGQLGAGLRIPLSDRFGFDLGYRLRAAVEATLDGDGEEHAATTVYSHSVQLGLTYAFGENSQFMPPTGSGAGGSDWYVSVFGGGVFPEDVNFDYGSVYALQSKTGFTVGAAVGTHLAPGLRGELELSYLRHAIDGYTSTGDDSGSDASGHVEQFFALANVWKDIPLGMVSPYFGGGIGFGTTRMDDVIKDGDEVGGKAGLGFAGQLGAGARIGITDNLAADLSYRFKSNLSALIEGDPDGDTDNAAAATYNHVFQFGLTYGLGEGGDVMAAPPLEGVYVSLFGGGVFPIDTHVSNEASNYLVSFKDGFTVGAAVGADIANKLRGEIELSYMNYNSDNSDEGGDTEPAPGEVNLTFVMANVWRDFDFGGFQPYAGLGVGVAVADVDIAMDDSDDDNHINDTSLALAGQAGAGIRIPITDNITLDAGYRFKGALAVLTKGDVGDDGSHGSATYYSHVGQIGLTWGF